PSPASWWPSPYAWSGGPPASPGPHAGTFAYTRTATEHPPGATRLPPPHAHAPTRAPHAGCRVPAPAAPTTSPAPAPPSRARLPLLERGSMRRAAPAVPLPPHVLPAAPRRT